jgi:hypothetical protein
VRPYWTFPPPLPAMAAVGRRAWPPPPRGARARFLGRHHGLRRPATVRQRHHPAMHAGKLSAEVGWPRLRHSWLRLGAGSTVVPSPSPEDSPAASWPSVSSRPCPAHLQVGPVSAWGPFVSRNRQSWVHGLGCIENDFQKL